MIVRYSFLRILLSVLVISTFTFGAVAQNRETTVEDAIKAMFLRQAVAFPQEKIYVHTDRSHYISGDTVWLRAHTVAATSHRPLAISKFVYVDLIDPSGKVVNSIKIMSDEGIYKGYIPLIAETASGSYTLRAYTNLMKSAGQEYMPVKRIRVSDKAQLSIPMDMSFSYGRNGRIKGQLSLQDLRAVRTKSRKDVYVTVNGTFIDLLETNSKGRLQFAAKLPDPAARNIVTVEYDEFTRFFPIPAPEDEFDVSFFPEGGYLVDETCCTVGFKALRKDGGPIDVSGRVVDSLGNEITRFWTTHKGMGMFNMIPYGGKKYYAECVGPDSTVRRFELPASHSDALSLEFKRVGERIFLAVRRSMGFVASAPMYMVMHIRGNPVSVQKVDLARNGYMEIDDSNIPPGVLHILLIDKDFNVFSERLAFVSGSDHPQATVATDRESYGRRQLVKATATVTDGEGNPLDGSFSVAVTDNGDILPDSTSNILTELLLASDLRGYVEDPGWYFDPANELAEEGLEALMLTQGWRRYDIPKMLKGDVQSPADYLEIGEEITGKVRSLWRPVPVTDATVSILHKNVVFFDKKEVDEEGAFSFSGFDIPEGSRLFIQALSKKRNKRVELLIDQQPTLPVDQAMLVWDVIKKDDPVLADDSVYIRKSTSKLSAWDPNSFEIEEVVVEAKKLPRGFYSNQFLMGKTYDKKYIDKLEARDMRWLLQRLLPPLEIFSDSVKYKDMPVHIIFDNWELESEDVGYFLDLGVGNVEYIEIARDEQTTPFGLDLQAGTTMYGAVIAVYTTEGMGILNRPDRNFNSKTISPLGFQKPVEFYSPKYETKEDRDKWAVDKRTTLYWHPDLRTVDDGKVAFEFYSSDTPATSYSIVLEGIAGDGEVVRATGSVTVK